MRSEFRGGWFDARHPLRTTKATVREGFRAGTLAYALAFTLRVLSGKAVAIVLPALVLAAGLVIFTPAPPASACRPATAAGEATCTMIREQQVAPKKKVRKHKRAHHRHHR